MLKMPKYWQELSAFYQNKRDLFANALQNSRFKLLPSQGSFFQCVDYSEISQEFDQDLAVRLTKEIKVASIPISVFYEQPPEQRILRFCFAKTDDVLIEAANRLSKL